MTIAWKALNFASLPYIRISQLHDFWRGTFTIVLTRYLRFLTTKVFHSLRAWIMGNGKHSRETTGLQQDQMMSSWPWLSICGEFKQNGILDFMKSEFQLPKYYVDNLSPYIDLFYLNSWQKLYIIGLKWLHPIIFVSISEMYTKSAAVDDFVYISESNESCEKYSAQRW